MEKKYQIIYIWSFLIISGIILLLLYTPLGGDLHYAAYNEQGRYNVAPGVNFSSQVSGFSGSSSSGGSYNYTPTISEYRSPGYSIGASGGNYSTSTGIGNSGSYSGGGITLSNKSVSGSGGAGGSSGGGMMAVGGGRRSSSGVSGTFSGGGSIGGSLFNTTTTADGGVLQRAGDEDPPVIPNSDPGVEYELGSPLGMPLGNEMWSLLFIAFIFTFYKWLRITKK